jgi:hypothetical protein
MNIPGFNAESSLAPTMGIYRGKAADSHADTVVPAIPFCGNCDYILERCEQNGWRPRAVCDACATGYCYDKPPMPNPFPDPFPPLPRF